MEKKIVEEKKEEQTKEKKEDEEIKKEDRSTKNFLIAAGFLILLTIIFFVTRQVAHEPKYETMTYNGFKFVKIGPLWYFQWQEDSQLYNVPLRYNPKEVVDVPVTGVYDERFQQSDIYLTFDPAESGLSYIALSASELSISLSTVMGINIIAACTSNTTEACWDRPIITCDNTDKAIIYLREAPEAKIVLAGNCVVVQGKDIELLRAVDKLLYLWYKII